MRWFVDHYLSGGYGTAVDPRISPLLADDAALAASPPTFLVTADADVLRDEGEAYGARLESLGVPTSVTRYDGVFHGFFSFWELLDTGRQAIAEPAAAVARSLD